MGQISLLIAALLCSLVFGWVLLFHIVVMPGIAKLDDGGFLRAFQVMDGVIQQGQPVLLTVAAVIDVATQISTMTQNVPLNNRVKELDLSNMEYDQKRLEREQFEEPWNRWNLARTIGLAFVSAYLLVLLLLLEPVF